MVMFSDPEWIVLRHYIERSDKTGLGSIDSRHFTGLARSVYITALQLRTISMPEVLNAVRNTMDPSEYERIKSELVQAEPTETIETYERTLAQSYNNRIIKEAIDQASEDIRMGHDRRNVARRLVETLSSVHESVTVKSFDEITTDTAVENTPSIKSGFSAYEDIGLSDIQMGNIMVVAGDTGTYKTTTTLFLMFNILKANPDVHAYYFMKEQPAMEAWAKVFAMTTTFGYTNIQRGLNAQFPSAITEIRNGIPDDIKDVLRRLIIIDQRTFDTPGDVAAMLRSFQVRTPRMIWAVDYITRLDFGGQPQHFNSYYAKGLEILKNACLNTKSFGILIAQLKDGWNLDSEGRPQKIFPNRSHIIWSSELKNLASYILMLYHPGTYFSEPRWMLFHLFAKIRHMDIARRVFTKIAGETQSLLVPTDEERTQFESLTVRFQQRKEFK